jgi:hypothetical protein
MRVASGSATQVLAFLRKRLLEFNSDLFAQFH